MRFHFLPAALLAALALPDAAVASSHMDAPLIVFDDAANTTDVYAFVSGGNGSPKYLTTALAVYPFEEPGIGPNKYNFDDNVRYAIHVSLGNDRNRGRPTLSYFFEFRTRYRDENTILQSFTNVIRDVGDDAQNLVQTYEVSVLDRRQNRWRLRSLGCGTVPPNNQGNATPEYNLNAGEGPAKDGVATSAQLDRYTSQTIQQLERGYIAFAGQRDDGFYADIQAVFDLLRLRSPGVDAQRGFNVHTIVLQIPIEQLGGDMQIAGVYATTERQQVEIRDDRRDPMRQGPWIQVGRQGNPLFCEALVAVTDKDRYSRTSPDQDAQLFARYATRPELARLLNRLVFAPNPIAGIEDNRTDLAGIFIPDLIKVDLSTAAVPLAGAAGSATNPNDPTFSRLSVFGNDTIFSPLQQTMVPSGWPNGRRFGDDVLDIAVSAVISDLRVSPPVLRTAGDNVNGNDIAYNKVMPYAATPLNGRTHTHH